MANNPNITSDVRRNIPFTALTDPAAFPPYEHREFPKMMLKPDGKPYMGPDDMPITVADEDEEAAFRAEHETMTIVNDRQLNSAERAELEELRKLRDQSQAGDPAEDKPNQLAGLTKLAADKKSSGGKTQQLKTRDGAPLPKPIPKSAAK